VLIALRHALKNYLPGRGLPAVIRAVIDGELVPVGHTDRFAGITGYPFPCELLRRYRPLTAGVRAPQEGFLNYRDAAALLGFEQMSFAPWQIEAFLRLAPVLETALLGS
jgi:hypothetical protein